MNEYFTVYFDTSFYVGLCRADQKLADQIISELNALQVRPVISDVIILELLSSGDRTDRDALLVERVSKFAIAPYEANSQSSWEVLLLAGDERRAVSEQLKLIDDLSTEAKSYSIMARRKVSKEAEEKLREARQPIIEAYGFPADFEKDMPQVMDAAKNMLQGMFEQLGIDHDIEWPTDPTSEKLLSVSSQIEEKLGPSVVKILEQQDRLYDSVTATDERPYQVAASEASSKTRKKLANTLRDSEHMMRFAQHSQKIHLLQVDNAQEQQIKRGKPVHELAELNLAERCFSASTLVETVDTVRRLKDLFANNA